MIDVKDLMLGNWVMVDDPEYWYHGVCDVTSLVYDDEFTKYAEGIEVTEDILDRIGFEGSDLGINDGECEWRCWQLYLGDCEVNVINTSNTPNKKPWMILVDNNANCSIGGGEFCYIHELQNLVRVIVGNALPIKKEVFE